jgi:hypothetical protein
VQSECIYRYKYDAYNNGKKYIDEIGDELFAICPYFG